MTRLVFVDETTSGARDTAFAIEIPDAPLTVRDVIRARIHEEAARFNSSADADVDADAQAQCEAAFRAFERNGFLVLVGDRQMTELDALVVDGPHAEITFLKLIPLVGG